MATQNPTWFQVARRPKWIGALLLSLLVAAIFAALGQWQLDRAFTKDARIVDSSPGYALGETFNLMLDTKNVFIVANRLQDGQSGYWVLANSYDEKQVSHTLALGWVAELKTAESFRTELMSSMQAQAFIPYIGAALPVEAPQKLNQQKPYLLESVSTAQLINLYSPQKPIAVSPGYYALCDCKGGTLPGEGVLQTVNIDYGEPAESVNWLSAFYFLEWMLFAGFAVFLWWRLVRDEQIRLGLETVN